MLSGVSSFSVNGVVILPQMGPEGTLTQRFMNKKFVVTYMTVQEAGKLIMYSSAPALPLYLKVFTFSRYT
jgi:hypothetical protein